MKTEDFILGDSALHQRLCAITEILGKFVACAPRQLSIWHLAESTGKSELDLENLCAGLTRAALLQSSPNVAGSWSLACAPDQVTLEDVFRCAMAEQPAVGQQVLSASQPLPGHRPQRQQHDANLLVMQAAMAINQSVFLHLRQFSLDRLKISSSVSFPAPRSFRHISRRSASVARV
ncbi:Rrf2 family transcriptional regulator [Actimicrobium sp. CCC2.4]|uniref:Rrf2 family transcriptional regulator n=1 Tax=Actimicrobium sp. CCC2.4 TaxID=3048606 RepID=UPI002AC8F6AF|nr:Rrf2 family transcriptional regulator [Actimicrobium sp. CCC2.4]MEB0135929.1 Rrf2 family transcriptional regulator [Actimicrobium sp. CCC2.4]WPX32595.1 Rrf2 family transcriptional regulator [Actimicrobium sp. CCC2.4]